MSAASATPRAIPPPGSGTSVDTADGGIPISASDVCVDHDSQVGPLGTLTAGRVENLYDHAADSIEIWAHSILLGHKPIIA